MIKANPTIIKFDSFAWQATPGPCPTDNEEIFYELIQIFAFAAHNTRTLNQMTRVTLYPPFLRGYRFSVNITFVYR